MKKRSRTRTPSSVTPSMSVTPSVTSSVTSPSPQCLCPLPSITTSNNIVISSLTTPYTHFIKEQDIVSSTQGYEPNMSSASGDFRFTRDFFIVDEHDNQIHTNGFIIQKITKRPNVSVPDAEKNKSPLLTTSDHISDYTSGAVKYMSDTYVEAFIVIKGRVLHADAFQNASILRHAIDIHGDYRIIPTAPDTEGTITQIGEYYYIPSKFKNATTIRNEIVNSYKIPMRGQLTHPAAAGLPSSTDVSLYDAYKVHKISPEYKFTLTVEWDADDKDSRIDRKTIHYGGNRKKRSINRKNKRKTKKSV